MSNRTRTVVYVGMTGNLQQRYIQHLSGVNDGFTKQNKCHDLVYYEQFDNAMDAIEREKYLKKLSRRNKELLIDRMNPTRTNLAAEWKETYFKYVRGEEE